MNGHELVQALREGRRVYGTLVVSPAPEWPKAVAGLGLDFVFIDTEHIALDRAQLSWMCRAYSAMGLAPVVRIPSPDPYRASMALDGGAEGVVAPYVESPEEVRALAGAVKYGPLKGERLRAFLEGEACLEPELESWLEQRNAGKALVVNIESRPAMDALDDILAVPGLDAVLVGPHDLSVSLGMPAEYHHPEFERAVDDIVTRARARGKGVGVHLIWPDGLEQWKRWAALGANLIVHLADIIAFRLAMQEELAALRAALGDGGGESGEGSIVV